MVLTMKTHKTIMRKILDKGFECYICGGAVRDHLLGLEPHDIDLCTNAKLKDLMKIFPHIKVVGNKFKVYMVDGVEIAQYRTEGDYDGRRPKIVRTASTLEQDSERRDFTINAMYMSVDGKIIDFHNGENDLDNKYLRCVGDPYVRMQEDHLRILRMARFYAKIGGIVDMRTLAAASFYGVKLLDYPPERIISELRKVDRYDRFLDCLESIGVFRYIFPFKVNMLLTNQPKKWHPEGNVWNHTRDVIRRLERPSFLLFMAALLHDVGKITTTDPEDNFSSKGHDKESVEIARRWLTSMKLPNDEIDYICGIIENHMKIKYDGMKKSKWCKLVAQPYFDDLAALAYSDSNGNADLSHLDEVILNKASYVEKTKLPPLITGHDLIELGMEPGPEFGRILRTIEELQLEGDLIDKDEALGWIYSNI